VPRENIKLDTGASVSLGLFTQFIVIENKEVSLYYYPRDVIAAVSASNGWGAALVIYCLDDTETQCDPEGQA
jgi:hypothetical protein